MSDCDGGVKFHKDLKNIHRVHCFEYADTATRLAATGFTTDDIGRVARQLDDDTWWVLASESPVTWCELTNKTVPPDTDIKVGVTSNDTTAGFLDDKISVTVGTNPTDALEKSVLNGGSNEGLQIQLDPDKINTDEAVKVQSDDSAGFLSPKLAAGSNITLNVIGSPGARQVEINALAALSQNLAGVQARRSISFVSSLAWQDVEFNQTDVENLASVLEHDNTNTDRVLIKEDALYMVTYGYTYDPDASRELYASRVRLNDTTEIAGSFVDSADDFDEFHVGHSFLFEGSAGDFITLQIQQSTGSNNAAVFRNLLLTVHQLKGAKGDVGATGAGSNVNAESGGTPVSGGPFDTLNFSTDLTAVDGGSGTLDVGLAAPASVFGDEWQQAENTGSQSTTSTTYQNFLTLTTTSLPAGTYRIGVRYNWRHSSTGADFSGRLQLDNSDTLMNHQQEPKDTGTNQAYVVCWFAYRTLTAGVHTLDLDFREQSGGTATISNGQIELWRVS